ncbi:MAG: serine hydrolase [Eudoraea sp.]|nr:serine hydrolase [Eudoraea sp.]
MKNVFFISLLFSVLIAACSDKKKQSNSAQLKDPKLMAFEAQIEPIVNSYIDLGIFSGVVLVAKDGNPIFHEAYGIMNRNTNQKVAKNTLFDIGSMNKTFTSIVIKQLAMEGKLSLTDHLTDYIPGFTDPRAKEITISHLLEHQSGFGDYHHSGYFDLPLSDRKLGAIIERAKDNSLDFDPGTEQSYSNLGYVILGGVIEAVSGNSYFDNVQKRIVDRLKLNETYLNDFRGLEDRIAIGYYYTPLGFIEESIPIQDVPNPDGGFLSTTENIMRFYRSYYYEDILLSDKTKETDPFFNYLKEIPEGGAIGAAGGFEGFNSSLLQVINDDLTIIVFANMDEPVAERIASDILSTYRGENPDKPQLPAVQNIRVHFEKHGIDYIKEHFDELTVNFHPTDPKDLILNTLGYAYLYSKQDTDGALSLFKLNTDLFPDIANCWDSYGEALRKKGDDSAAIKAYGKALEIRPDLESAITALNELKK